MRDCPDAEIRDLLPDYAGGSLTGEALSRVEAHVAGCADCAAEVDLLRAVRRAGPAAPAVDVARIVAALPAPTRARPRGRVAMWRVAAAVAVLAAGGVALRVVRDGGPPMPAHPDSAIVSVAPLAGTPAADSPAAFSPAAPAPAGPRVAVAVPRRDSAARPAAPAPSAGGDLSMTGGLSDLSDADVEALLGELRSLDAVPAIDPEPASAPFRRRGTR